MMKKIKFKVYFVSLFLCLTILIFNNVSATEYECDLKNNYIETDETGKDLFYYEQVFDKYENDTCIYRNVKVVKYAYYNNVRKIVNEKKYDNNKMLISQKNNEYSKVGLLTKATVYSNYKNNEYRKRVISKYNNKQTRIYYAVLIKHSNLKTKSNDVRNYFSNKKLKKRTYNKYNTKGIKNYSYSRINFSNGKIKLKKEYSNYNNGVWRTYKYKSYRKVNNKSYKKQYNLTKRKSNKVKISVKKYYYNKKGQLRSNKNGNAYRKYYTYFSNNKIAKYYKHKYTSKGKLKRIIYKYYKKNKPNKSGVDKITKCNYSVKVPKGMTINHFKDFCKNDDKNMNGVVDGHEVVENIIFSAPNTKEGRKKANNMFGTIPGILDEAIPNSSASWFEFEAQQDAILFGYHDYKKNYVIAIATFNNLYDKENDMKKIIDAYKNNGYTVIGNIVYAK